MGTSNDSSLNQHVTTITISVGGEGLPQWVLLIALKGCGSGELYTGVCQMRELMGSNDQAHKMKHD